MTEPSVSVVVTCLNGITWIDKCLPPLLSSSLKDFEVIFVDNGSADGTLAYLTKHYDDPRIVTKRLDQNRGFTGGNNYGATFARAPLLFFLSVDVAVHRDTLTTLMKAYRSNHGVVGPRVLNITSDGRGGEHSTTQVVDVFGYPANALHKKPFYIEGCAFLIGRERFLECGGFDEGLVTYAEDVDLCWRMWLQGYENAINEDTHVYHCGGSSSVHYSSHDNMATTYYRRFHTAKNIIRNALKNYKVHNALLIVPCQIVLLAMEAVYYLTIQRNFVAFKNIIAACYWNMVNISDTLAQRKQIQRLRRNSDHEVIGRMIRYPVVFDHFLRHGGPRYVK